MTVLVLALLTAGLAAVAGGAFAGFRRRHIPILLYHYFCEGEPQSYLEVPVAAFRSQLARLKASGYRVVPLEQLPALGPTQGRTVAITVDDGDESFFRLALPVLAEFGYPVTVFVVPQFADAGCYHSGAQSRKAEAWEGIARELGRLEILSVGSHSLSHADLRRADDTVARTEIAGSLAALAARLPRAIAVLAYPFGRWSPALASQAQAAGYSMALATTFGDPTRRERFQIEREPVYAGTGPWAFRLKLSGAYSFIRNLRPVRAWRAARWAR